MNRDGAQISIWQDDVPEYQPVNSWNREQRYDVLIVGGGITGLTTALLLQQQGKQCILAEAHNLGFGTTGGTTAHLNTMLDTTYDQIERDFGKDQARLVCQGCREAIDLVEELVNQYQINCDFAYQPGYLVAETDDEVKMLDQIREASGRAGLVISTAPDGVPVPLPVRKALRFDFQAQLHASRYLLGLARAFEQLGGVVLQHCPVHELNHPDEGIDANTALGMIQASCLVYATHIPPGINLLHFRNAPYRSYAMALKLRSGRYPSALVYDMKEPYHYFRCQRIKGQDYVIAGGFDHKTGHEENTGQVFRELEAYLRGIYDVESVDYQWSSQYYVPADGLPYIGKLPGYDRIFTGTGYNGNGITLGSLAGRIISDMIIGRQNPYESLYSPSRIKPIAGFKEFVKENADVVSKFIGMRFSYEDIQDLVALAPGEGRLVNYQKQKMALYKDENGLLHAIDPVCKHAGCIVAWNGAEKSWDCPCHGARYAPNGDLLTGPARSGLDLIQWKSLDGD